MGRNLICLLVFIVLACGCKHGSIDMDVGESSQVLFSVDATKTDTETTFEWLKTNGFQTLLYKNGREKLRDETVTWSEGFFRFAQETLWPGDGETLSAYACASPAYRAHMEEIDGKPLIKLITDNEDWKCHSDICLARAEDISGGGIINLSFRHILGKISGVYVKTTYTDEEKICLANIFLCEARNPVYDIRSDVWSADEGDMPMYLDIDWEQEYVGHDYRSVQKNLCNLYMTPGKKTIVVDYSVFNTATMSFDPYSKLADFELEPGKDYKLQINISEDFVSLSCVSSAVTGWSDGGEISGTGL